MSTPTLPRRNDAPRRVTTAVRLTGLIDGSSAITITSPDGWGAYVISESVFQPRSTRYRSDVRRARERTEALEKRVVELRSILRDYVDRHSRIVDEQTFQDAFAVEEKPSICGRTCTEVVIYDAARTRRVALSSTVGEPLDQEMAQDRLRRVTSTFFEWSALDARRLAATACV